MKNTAEIIGTSLYALAEMEGVGETVREQIQAAAAAQSRCPEFFSLLDSPALSRDERADIIDKVFSGCHEYVINTLKLLMERRGLSSLAAVAESCEAAYMEAHGLAAVTVTTAAELSAEEEAALTAKLKKLLSKDIILTKRTDSSILGGVIIRADDLLIDGSLRRRLGEIKKILSR